MGPDEITITTSSTQNGNCTTTNSGIDSKMDGEETNLHQQQQQQQQQQQPSTDLAATQNDTSSLLSNATSTTIINSDSEVETCVGSDSTQNLLPNRPTLEVARDTKRILEICYGNNQNNNGNSSNDSSSNHNNSSPTAAEEVSIEVKHIELNPKPSKKKHGTKKATTSNGTASTTKKKKKKTTTTTTKNSTEDGTVEDDTTKTSLEEVKDGEEGDEGGALMKVNKNTKKRKKKTKIVTITKTVTNEDGTVTTTIIKKKKRKRKKKTNKAAIPRDAAGRIVRKRRKIKNRHRVVKKELIKKGKDAKIDLPTIEESGMSSEEDDSSSSNSSDDSDSDYEDSTLGDSSQYTLETMYTYESGDDNLIDSDDEEEEEEDHDDNDNDGEMMVVYEDDENELGDDQDGKLDNIVVESVPGRNDMVGTDSTTTESLSSYLGGSLEPVRQVDLEVASTPETKTNGENSEQPKDRSFGSSANTDADSDCDHGRSKGIMVWSKPRMICAGFFLVMLIAGVVIVIVYFVTGKKSETTEAPSEAPTMKTSAPSTTPTIMPTVQSTTILNTSSTVCRLPSNESKVLILQAEDADSFLGTALGANETSGYCGDGYVTDFLELESAIVFFAVAVEKTGFYRVAIRYSNQLKRDLSLRLRIDDEFVGDFALIPTGNWSTWMIAGIDNIVLRHGSNHSIEILTSDDNNIGPNVDWLSLRFQNSLSRFEYLTNVLAPLTDVASPTPTQISALLWMSTEDPLDWETLSDQEIVERFSLVQFYRSTEGDLWTTNNEWLSEFHVCDWYGVGCSENRLVTDLILDENGLYGSLPLDFFLLTDIKAISLKTNSLEGTLGGTFTRFQNLESLLLEANFLSGSIPDQIGNLKHLTILDLGSNDLTGKIPDTLYDMGLLQTLVLSTNNLNGTLSTNIGNLLALKELDSHGNQISGKIPTQLGLLTNLTSLILGYNLLSGTIPSELALLTNLLILDLNTNELTGSVPEEFEALNETAIDYYGNVIRNPR